jgi:hypothetical protein
MDFEPEFWQIPPDPNQPPLSEEEIIHTVLEYVATKLPNGNLMHSIDPIWVLREKNIALFKNLAMHRMVSEGLITTETTRHSSLGILIKATPHGVRVAKHSGGYYAYATAQRRAMAQERQARFENDRLAQGAARATIDAAESARVSTLMSKRALTISKVAIAIPSIIAIAALVAQVISSSDTATELALAKNQIKELQKQVRVLSNRK